ncbi:MAG: hypothetical protein WBH28_14075 [Fuerstiella sp.]|mgnify:CR=1 FL=1
MPQPLGDSEIFQVPFEAVASEAFETNAFLQLQNRRLAKEVGILAVACSLNDPLKVRLSKCILAHSINRPDRFSSQSQFPEHMKPGDFYGR